MCKKSAGSLFPPKSDWSLPICWWKTSAIFSICNTPPAWKKNSTRSKKAKRSGKTPCPSSQEVPEGSQICRKAYGEHQADGEAHGREVRKVWRSAGDQVGQARLVLCLQYLRQGRSEYLHVYQR